MGSPVDLTLGRSSSESQAVPSSKNGYHGVSSTYPSHHQREAAEEYLRTLKEERRKVEGFKRELPLCIELLDDAIKAAEEKLVHGNDVVLPVALRLSSSLEKENGGVVSPESRRPTLEEFLPLKRREREDQPSDIGSDGEGAADYCGTQSKQPAWMAEAPLWNQTTSRSTEVVRDEMTRNAGHSEQEQSCVTSSQQQRPTGAGAFLPFQPQHPSNAMPVVSRPKPRSGGFCTDLNLGVQSERPATTLRAASDVEVGSAEAAAAAAAAPDAQTCKDVCTSGAGNQFSCGGGGGGGNSSSSTRKARRCWSPELHRRFISALQQLGGSHIATPKQLRELMKVDGLTNDEVKSHLQKYRLHTRRPSSSSPQTSAAAVPAAAPQLVVVGGIWMPPQHAASASTPMQVLQLHRQPIFESPQAAGTSQSQSSPQGPLQVTSQLSGATQGSSSETYESGEEEAKSQSTSWNFCRQHEGSQNTTVESSQRGELAEPKKINLKMHEHGNAVQFQLVHTSG